MFAELAFTEDVSSRGARVRTKVPWKPGTHVFVKSWNDKFWARARVVYCQVLRVKTCVLGLEFYARSHRYSLTFRCMNCGRHEASANFRSDRIQPEDQIKEQIYPAQCTGCGWKGEACGLSAIRILRYKSKETNDPANWLPIVTKKLTEKSVVCYDTGSFLRRMWTRLFGSEFLSHSFEDRKRPKHLGFLSNL